MSEKMQTPGDVALNLESRDDVTRAVSTWDDCDVAVLVEDGTNIAPIRRGRTVAGITNFDAAPYTLVELDLN
ncbi:MULTISPECIES: hypothetical protein [Halorussus]|uniref:hypothetical protein n=1 Tax=Halorussus TaxID=1070314 RepID=UPI00209F09F5|nr:hypothetical protein [Halorussus vallis]USZ78742.1 hypothetical protein NGM07_24840 [Halorussus vallis]